VLHGWLRAARGDIFEILNRCIGRNIMLETFVYGNVWLAMFFGG